MRVTGSNPIGSGTGSGGRSAEPPPDQAPAAAEGHGQLTGQPHDAETEGPVADAEVQAARIRTDANPLGTLGKPFNWRSPFFIGVAATAGVAATYAAIQLFLIAGDVFILIGLSFFLAVGMEPAVSWLVRHKFPRWLGVVVVLIGILGIFGGFIAAAIPAVVEQGTQLVKDIPGYLQQANDSHTFIGDLNQRFGIATKLQSLFSDSGSSLFNGILGAGAALFSAFSNTLIVLVLTIYLLADMPRIRALLYRMVPHTRRPRAILIGDDILAKVGGYVLGNLIISVIAGGLAYIWMLIFGVPYALLLAILVAILDLVPVVGSTIAGVAVALVALTVSLPVCLFTIGFFVVYRLVEDYFLVPRIIGRAVEVPALVTVVAVLIGAALLGIVGALVAIPFAAALLLLAREMLFPRLDRL